MVKRYFILYFGLKGYHILKIIHYLFGLPPVREGGLVGYVLDLAGEQMKQGDKVYLLVPGSYKVGCKTKIVKKKWELFECFFINNSLPVTGGKSVTDINSLYVEGDIKMYRDFLKQLDPDIIHIHSFMGLHKEFMQAANALNIATIFTSHDYYGLCPKATLFKRDLTLCDGNWEQCSICMGRGMTISQVAKYQSPVYGFLKRNSVYHWMEYSPYLLFLKRRIKRKNKQKKAVELPNNDVIQVNQDYKKLKEYYKQMFYHIKFFHFNSIQAETEYKQQLGDIKGEVVYIGNKKIRDRRQIYHYEKRLKIGFIAHNVPNKGFEMLKSALDEMYCEGMTEMECHIFNNYNGGTVPYMVRHTPYKETEIEKAFSLFDVLVVPSLWKETFGLVVLEAISFGKPVIMTENVGAKELLLSNNIGIVVKPDKESLKRKLIEIYNDKSVLKMENKKINKAEIKFNFTEHCHKIVELYKKASAIEEIPNVKG